MPAQPAPQAPNIQSIVADPKFKALPAEAQVQVLSHIDPHFANLPGEAQQQVLAHMTAAPPKQYLPGRQFGMEVAKGMGLDAEKIKAAEDAGGQGEGLKEIGRQVFEGLSGFGMSVLKDPFNAAKPITAAASNIENAVKQKSPGQLVGALSTVLGPAEGASKIAEALPSAERAAQALGEVKGAAGKIPIDMAKPGATALELYTQAQRGASMPKVVRDFVNRATKPESDPITYAEAKDFQSNVSSLSAEERMQAKPATLRLIGQLNSDLKASLEDAADTVGKGQQFADAMKEYHNAMQLKGFSGKAMKILVGSALGVTGLGIAKKILGALP
jgi:hypothetical protein